MNDTVGLEPWQVEVYLVCSVKFRGKASANRTLGFIHKYDSVSSNSLLLKGNRMHLKLLEPGCERL